MTLEEDPGKNAGGVRSPAAPPSVVPPLVALTVFKLPGAGFGELMTLIAEAFGRSDLKQLVKINLDINLDELVDLESNRSTLVFELLEALEQRGNTPLFLHHVVKARPARHDIRAAVERYCPQALETLSPPETDARKAAIGVEMLRDRLDTPAVRSLVTLYRAELTQLMDDVDALANYKALHDYLHTIQLRHYPRLVDNVKRIRTDPLAVEEIETHIYNLQDICHNARKAAGALPEKAALRAEETEWVTMLETSIADLRKAVENLDDQDAARAVRSLRQIIRAQPFRVNTRLTLTAENLPLERLIETLKQVIAIKAIPGNGVTTTNLENALGSLQNLLPQLRGRVAEHKQWQAVDNDFWAAAEFVEKGTPESIEEFHQLWPAAKSSVEALWGVDPEADWAKTAQKLADLVTNDLPNHIDSARINFRRFRNAALDHFYQVDKALKSQCEAILAIRAPLRSLLSEV